jgi:7-cyano-7-deazaguanine synthase in queuosine biosynthesis
MKHNVLFTGGWDSTFRLCQLSFRDVEVQPVYFDGQRYYDRTNWKKEMQAQDDVLALLRQKEATKAVFHDPIRLTDKDLPKDDAFDRAFEKWSPCDLIPGQLRFLGKVAKLYPDLEYCIEGPTLKRRRQGFKKGKTHAFLEEQGFKFKFHPDGSTDVDSSKADPDLQLLWGGLTFPILGITEQDMVPYIHRWGYEDVFAKTWTCDFGGDEPCGVCHNCETKWASGLKNFFPPAAVRNHKIKKYLEKMEKAANTSGVAGFAEPGITRRFMDYIHNGYRVKNVANILTLPYALQPIIAKVQENHNAELQMYFDRLIAEWDEKKGQVV